jgi:hypothetical protein
MNSLESAESIEVMDISGKRLYASKTAAADNIYDFSFLPKGIYVLNVIVEDRVLKQKLVIE